MAARPPDWLALLLLSAVVAFYDLLARRETLQLAGLPRRSAPVASPGQVARSERSTWAVVALFLLLSCL